MDDIGYLYVLANSAMPGLVKVGKTTRTPSERANELSGVTGLPTPFIVVYEQMFENCSAAEAFVHTYLAQQGFRVSENREFFNAPVNDVVRAIMITPGTVTESNQTAGKILRLDTSSSHIVDELDDWQFGSQLNPWHSVYEEAESFNYGLGECIQDQGQALKLYIQSTKLGSLEAYSKIGLQHEKGSGTQVNLNEAFNWYKEGAKKGNTHCYWAMGMLFLQPTDPKNPIANFSNSEKCFSSFIKKSNNAVVDEKFFTSYQLKSVIDDSLQIISYYLTFELEYPYLLNDFFKKRSNDIQVRATNMVDYCKETNFIEGQELYSNVITYLKISDFGQKFTE